jgi:hypothetical protein
MVGAGIAVVLGGAAIVGFLISHHRAAQAAAMPKCTGIATRLAGVWDAATKAGVEHAFAGKRSFAPEMFQATTAALDAYAAEWTAAVTDNCEATRVRGEQAEDVMGLHPGLAAGHDCSSLGSSLEGFLGQLGGKGLHVVAPLEASATFDEAMAVSTSSRSGCAACTPTSSRSSSTRRTAATGCSST